MPTTAVAQNIPAKIISALMRRIFFIIPTFIISWALHTYILVVKNEGFGDSSIWGKWVNTVGNTSSSLVVWGLVSALIWSFIYSSFKFGPVRTIGNFIKAPFWTFKYIAGSGKAGFGAFLMGSGLALYLSAAIQFKTSANICLALALSIVGLSQPGFLLATYFAKGWMWVVNFVSKRKDDKFGLNFRGAHLMVVGLSPGFLLCAFLKPQIAQILGVIAIILGVVFFFNIKAPKKSLLDIAGLFFIGSIFTAAYFMIKEFFPKEAFADDGGWQESGGTFIGWIKSQGCLIAVFRGVPPSISSSLGPLTPSLVLVDPTKIPIDINPDQIKISIDTNTLTQMSEGFNDGDTQELSIPLNKQEIQDMLDQGRGYKVNPDGSVTIAEYQPGMVAYIAGALGWAQSGCDHTVSILEGMTGPPGKVVSYGYTFIKNVGGSISTAIADGTSIADGLKTGALKGVYDIGVAYVGGKIFDKVGLGSPEAPDLSKVNVNSVVSIMTGNATTQLKKEAGFKTAMENNGKKLVKAVFVGQGEGQIKAASSKQLMNTIVTNSIKGDITGTISGTAGDAGWDAMKNYDGSSGGSSQVSGGGMTNPADQLDR